MSADSAVSQLTDRDLALKLKEHGISAGPITSTTRALFEKKLDQCINGNVKKKEEVKDEIVSVTPNDKDVFKEKANDAPKMYFAVQVPFELRSFEESYILTDKKEALQLAKKYAGSRFKIFQCKDLAEQYTSQSEDTITASPKPETQVKTSIKQVPEGSAFRGPKFQDLVAFKNLLEQGKLESVKSTVWNNPRYLINSGDTPTILQERFRYNALHVCSAKNQAGSAELVLSLLKDESLFKLMYPDDSAGVRLERMTFILDLYLNMPDKGVNETPLHFACKFGHMEVVQVLVTQSALDKERVNKYGEKPHDIVCSRLRNGGTGVKQQIYSLLSDQCYVPLIRALDDTEPPQVSRPVSPERVAKLDAEKYGSPKETPHTIRAMAGPMSPVQAEKFRKTWTTPPSPTMKDRIKYTSIRRGDPTKGMERIGRDLAHMLRIPWSEYWEFLDTFVDLSTADGIDVLERYLREKGEEVSHEMSLNEDMDCLQSLLCNLELESRKTTTQQEVQGNIPNTPNNSLFRGVQVKHVQQDGIVHKPNPFMPKSFLNAGKNDIVDKQSSVVCDGILSTTNKSIEQTSVEDSLTTKGAVDSNKSHQNSRPENSVDDLICAALGGLSVKDNSEKAESSENSNKTSSNCDTTDNAFIVKKFLNYENEGTLSSSHLHDQKRSDNDLLSSLRESAEEINVNELSESSTRPLSTGIQNINPEESKTSVKDEDPEESCSSEENSVYSYHTATDSSEDEEGDVFVDSFDSTDADTSPTHLSFVYGREPSKTDVDVLRAISAAEVSPVRHPHVFSWRNAVTCYSEQSRTKWNCNTPGRRLSQSTPRKQAFTPRSKSLGMSPLLGSPVPGGDHSVSFSMSESSCSDSSFTDDDETTRQIRANLIPSFLSETNA